MLPQKIPVRLHTDLLCRGAASQYPDVLFKGLGSPFVLDFLVNLFQRLNLSPGPTVVCALAAS